MYPWSGSSSSIFKESLISRQLQTDVHPSCLRSISYQVVRVGRGGGPYLFASRLRGRNHGRTRDYVFYAGKLPCPCCPMKGFSNPIRIGLEEALPEQDNVSAKCSWNKAGVKPVCCTPAEPPHTISTVLPYCRNLMVSVP